MFQRWGRQASTVICYSFSPILSHRALGMIGQSRWRYLLFSDENVQAWGSRTTCSEARILCAVWFCIWSHGWFVRPVLAGSEDSTNLLFSFHQAKRAVQRGATAVIFDVSENPEAIDQVKLHQNQFYCLSERHLLCLSWVGTVVTPLSQILCTCLSVCWSILLYACLCWVSYPEGGI